MSTNRTIIDISILQSVPPSNINRDDTGSPKTALYGGARRARVSSQAWKRATRLDFEGRLDAENLGVRTKRIVELLGERIQTKDESIAEDRAQELAKLAFTAAGIKLTQPRGASKENPKPDEAGYLLFLSSLQLDQLAEAAILANATDDPEASLKGADLKKKLNQKHSVDIALFGRMVADSSDLNVDAAVQVAHAISVHKVENEFDYFTAVDDHKNADTEEDAGAGMIGNVEFNSSTLYRYATVDVDLLNKNLGDAEATRRAVEAFVEAFSVSLPSGKQNTFANRTLPDAIVVSIRDSQPVNLVGAFQDAIAADVLATASARLVKHAQRIDENFGTAPVTSWVVHNGGSTSALEDLGQTGNLPSLVASLGETVAARLAAAEKA